MWSQLSVSSWSYSYQTTEFGFSRRLVRPDIIECFVDIATILLVFVVYKVFYVQLESVLAIYRICIENYSTLLL